MKRRITVWLMVSVLVLLNCFNVPVLAYASESVGEWYNESSDMILEDIDAPEEQMTLAEEDAELLFSENAGEYADPETEAENIVSDLNITSIEVVDEAAEAAPLKIIKQPRNVVVAEPGANAVLTIEAEGEGLTYRWYYKNPANISFADASEAGTRVIVPITKARNGRQMYCVVTDANGNQIQSETVTMTIATKGPVITKQPEDVEVAKVGDNAFLTIKAEGEGLTYRWYYKNPANTSFSFANETGTSVTVPVTEARNGRQMYCVIRDANGNEVQSSTVTMTIKVEEKLLITKQPESVEVAKAGDNATLTIEAEGSGLMYRWYYKNPTGTSFVFANETGTSVTVPVTEARNGRQMYCVVRDANGNEAQSRTVTMTIKVKEKLVITKQPESVEVVKAGDNATLMIEAEGSGLTYRWYYKNPTNTSFVFANETGTSVTVPVTEARNGRQMYCVVRDANGNEVQSNTVTMTIKSAEKLVITKQPESAEVAKVGDNATLTIEAEGSGLTYRWYYKNPTNTSFAFANETGRSVTVPVTEARNGRQMYCVVRDANGNEVQSSTVTMTIKVEEKLLITKQPESVEVAKAGDNATLTIEAEGTSLTYRWYYKNPTGTSFAFANETGRSVTVPVTEARNGRQMYCVVRDANGNEAQSKTVSMTIAVEEEKNSFTVTPSSLPYNNRFVNSSYYTSETAGYFMLLSYLSQMERTGGGTLILQEGTYNVCGTLFVPDNVTLCLEAGAKIVLSQNVGSSGLSVTKTLFRIGNENDISNIYPDTKTAAGNVKITGAGMIDLGSVDGAVGILCRQNDDVTIENIQITGGNNGAAVRVASSSNVTIKGLTMTVGSGMSAIQLTAQYGNIPSSNVIISNCLINGGQMGISTAAEASGQPFESIQIIGNIMENCTAQAVYGCGMKNAVITGNTFRSVGGTSRAVALFGITDPVITGNLFEGLVKSLYFGTTASWSENRISDNCKTELLSDNSYKDLQILFVEYVASYGSSIENWKQSWKNLGEDTSTVSVTPDSSPYQNKYTNLSSYTQATAVYYMLQSYMDHFEEIGYGSLTLKAGTYPVCNTLFVPENVTLTLEAGAQLVLSQDVGSSGLTASSTLLRISNKMDGSTVFKDYSGASGVTICGSGTIDLGNVTYGTAVQCRQNDGVTVRGLSFTGGQNSAYIAVNSAKNVTVQGCTFNGSSTMEGVRLNTQYNDIPCADIDIQENLFSGCVRGIYTNVVTIGVYTTGVTICGNTFSCCTGYGIAGTGLKDVVIENNILQDMTVNRRAIYLTGVSGMLLQGNTFERLDKPVMLNVSSNWPELSLTEEQYSIMLAGNSYREITSAYVEYIATYGSSVQNLPVTWENLSTNNSYRVAPGDKTFNGAYTDSSSYNDSTADYFMLRSYLEQLENIGGGTLTLASGTYNIPGTLYLASGVTVILEDGVILNKNSETGGSDLNPSAVLFAFVSTADSIVENVASGYKGAGNITIQGEGQNEIRLSYGQTAFYMAHNQDITLDGLNVTQMTQNSSAFMLRGCSDVTISGCTINGGSTANSMGVSVESTADTISQGVIWCGMDNTGCRNITISGSSFTNLERGISTSPDSRQVAQEYIVVRNSSFDTIANDTISMVNWNSPVVENCSFIAAGSEWQKKGDTHAAIRARLVRSPVITGNTFTSAEHTIYVTGFMEGDVRIANEITADECERMAQNNVIGTDVVVKYIMRDDIDPARQYYYPDDTHAITVGPDDAPYKDLYYKYSEENRQYYALRAGLEVLDRSGGGTLTIQAGEYTLDNSLYIASNITVQLEDGVVIRSQGNEIVFIFCSPQDWINEVKYTAYNGVHNSALLGPENGMATIDLQNNSGMAVMIAHTTDVEVANITFTNMNSQFHFVELDSSLNCHIHNCMFRGSDQLDTFKEAINVDVPDLATGGFIADFSSYDKVGNCEIHIEENVFQNLPVGIGTHMYTDTAPHTSVYIRNNTFTDCMQNAVHASNWVDTVITGNTIRTSESSNMVAFNLQGVKNPVIKENTIENAYCLAMIQVVYYDETFSEELQSYAPVYNDISEQNKADLLSNTVINVYSEYSYYSNSLDGTFERWNRLNADYSDIEVLPESATYANRYINYPSYTEETKTYYMIQSYLDHLEEIGGGALTLSQGTYTVCHTLFVPANVTLNLSEGATLVLSQDVGNSGLSPVTTLIRVSNKADMNTVFESYSGAGRIVIQGAGRIDLGGINYGMAMQCRQNDGVVIRGLTFTGGQNSAYLVLNSTKNVTVQNCTFNGNSTMTGIRLNTQYNSMPCMNITAEDNAFAGCMNGVSTNAVTAGVYTGGVRISGNVFTECTAQSIYMIGLETPCITGNTISNMADEKRAVILYEVKEPDISSNTFRKVDYPIALRTQSGWEGNTISEECKNTMITTNNCESVRHSVVENYAGSSGYEQWLIVD